MTIRAQLALVVFDMDGVLAHLDMPKRLETLASLTGKTAEFVDAALYASDFERSAEAGAYPTGAEYLAECNRRIGASLTRDQWVLARRAAMTPNDATLELARSIQAAVPIATLTNNGALLKESIGEILPAAARIFGASFHASYEFEARKPDPKVFLNLATRYRVEPGAVLFIDDSPEFVAGARAAGLHGVHFRTACELQAELAAFGLRPTMG
jgi:putative hydrolase of the HAD superfamily